MLTTPLSERFGLSLPVVSASMAFVAGPRLAAAVSNAGGLGMLGGAMAPPEGLAGLVAATRGLTPRPFGVDLVAPFVGDGHIAVLAQVRPAVVVFFWGTPRPAWIARLQEAGIEVWMQVGRVAEAIEAADAGVDAIIAPGSEAGNIAAVLPAAAILEAFRREAADALNRLAGRGPRRTAA